MFLLMNHQSMVSSATMLLILGTSSCLFGAIDGAEVCPPVPDTGCAVCGVDKCVSNDDVALNVPGFPPTTCAGLQTIGLAGGIPAELCALVPGFISSDCGCVNDISVDPSDDDEELNPDQLLACNFGAETLTDYYGKSIPQTCIDMPSVGADGTATVEQRCYYTYVPTSCSSEDQKVPLVLDIHGANSCPLRSSTYTGWWEKAEEECFVVVWPSGEKRDETYAVNCFNVPGLAVDSDFGTEEGNNVLTAPCCCRDITGAPIADKVDDAQFLKAVIDAVLKDFESPTNLDVTSLSLDEDRVYLAGHSNGCIASLAVAALYSDTIAAVACHAGYLSTPYAADYSNAPVPTWLVHGVQDLVIEYEGISAPTPFGDVGIWSFPQITNYISQQNECSSSSEAPINDDTGAVAGTVFTGENCKNGATVEGVTLFESGHLPYNTPYPQFDYLGGSKTTIDTTALAWEFLSGKARAPAPTQAPTQALTSKHQKKAKKAAKGSRN